MSKVTSGVFLTLSCKNNVQMRHIQYVCLDASYAGRWDPHQPFGGSWSGTNGLRGVGLIRLVYSAVMIAGQGCTAQGFHLARSVRCNFRPIKVFWNICCFTPLTLRSRKETWRFYHYCCLSVLRGATAAERARAALWGSFSFFILKQVTKQEMFHNLPEFVFNVW